MIRSIILRAWYPPAILLVSAVVSPAMTMAGGLFDTTYTMQTQNVSFRMTEWFNFSDNIIRTGEEIPLLGLIQSSPIRCLCPQRSNLVPRVSPSTQTVPMTGVRKQRRSRLRTMKSAEMGENICG